MGENDQDSVGCPTPTAHKRLEEAHILWHECLRGYQDPEVFRVKLNACIQALRNLTFAVQKEKHLIRGFDNWYESWVKEMKTDKIMRWLQQARTTIVHMGDLETKSTALVRVIATYDDAASEVADGLSSVGGQAKTEFSTQPVSSLREVVDEIYSMQPPKRLLEQSILSIERRWIDRELPDIELLEALAHVFGFLSRLIADAHARAGLPLEVALEAHAEIRPILAADLHSGRLSCMVTTRADRTLNLTMRDGRPTSGGRSFSVTPDEDTVRQAEKRYKLRPVRRDRYPMSPIDYVPEYIENAKSIILSGEEHGWFIFLCKGRTIVGSRVLCARDSADKRILAQQLAELVAVEGIDGLIEVSETWQAPVTLDEEGHPVPPSEHPERTEAITIHAETAGGEHRHAVVPFRRRRFGRPVIGEIFEDARIENNFLAPVRSVWRRWREQESSDGAQGSRKRDPDS